MRNLMLLSLIVLSLAMNCMAAAPIHLGGESGKAVLMQVASVNVTSQVAKASQGDLWNWGKTPMNYDINSGKPKEQTSYDEYDIWLGAMNKYIPLNVSLYD
ncbi:Uncharacterised protein [uncultured archaeon]|nr:Uncharacterised protein [uncultured archaeon]